MPEAAPLGTSRGADGVDDGTAAIVGDGTAGFLADGTAEVTADPRWAQVLDQLWQRSRNAAGADEALAPWSPPPGLGPIPAELIPRAVAVMRGQQRAVAAARAKKADVQGRLRVMNQVPQLLRTDAPVYLDRLT